MLDEGNDLNLETPEAPPPEESNNRTFLIVGGIIAALIFLTLVCGAVYVLWLGPRLTAQRNAAQATIEAGNSQVIQQMTSTAQAALWTATPTITKTPTKTNTPAATLAPQNSPTSVIALLASPTLQSTAGTATVVALQTQLAQQLTATKMAQITGTPASGIPKTGFFDQVGLPGLILLTVVLVAVIFLSRRLRNAPTR